MVVNKARNREERCIVGNCHLSVKQDDRKRRRERFDRQVIVPPPATDLISQKNKEEEKFKLKSDQ